jgi:hypothetical protein
MRLPRSPSAAQCGAWREASFCLRAGVCKLAVETEETAITLLQFLLQFTPLLPAWQRQHAPAFGKSYTTDKKTVEWYSQVFAGRREMAQFALSRR